MWKCHSATSGRLGATPGRLHRMCSVKATVSPETKLQNTSVRVRQRISLYDCTFKSEFSACTSTFVSLSSSLPRSGFPGGSDPIYTTGIKFILTEPRPGECDQVWGIKVTSARLLGCPPALPPPIPGVVLATASCKAATSGSADTDVR